MAESVQQALGAAGSPPRVTWRGREYVVQFPTQAAKAELERLVKAAAVQAVEGIRDHLPPATYRQNADRVNDRVAAGDYDSDGRGWRELVFSPRGATLQLLALLRQAQPEVTEADAKAMAAECELQVGVALRTVYPDFFDMLVAGLNLPAAVRAELMSELAKAFPTPVAPSTTP
jgi:hypothetical protein